MSKEIWKPVVGYEGLYEVSNYGRIKSFHIYRDGFIRKSYTYNKYGHQQIKLAKKGIQKGKQLHLLVLEAFISPRPENKEGSHIDGNPTNNFIGNLTWETHEINMQRQVEHDTIAKGSSNGHSKLNEEQIPRIRKMLSRGMTQKQIGLQFGVHNTTISRIQRGENWTHV